MPKTVKNNATVRNVTLQDESGSVKLTLWDAHAQNPMKAGDRIKASNLRSKRDNYFNAITLTSTKRTTIEVSYTSVIIIMPWPNSLKAYIFLSCLSVQSSM